MLLGGPRLLPGVAAGALVTTTLNMSFASSLAVATGMVLQVIVDARLLERLKFDKRLERIRDPLVLASVTLLGAGVAAVFGRLTRTRRIPRPSNPAWQGLLIWWMRDWLGAQIVVALALTWVRSRPVQWTGPRIAEAIALVFGVVLRHPADLRALVDLP